MKLAFLITVNDDPIQLKRLTDSLPDSADCFIHVDKNTDLRPFTEKITSHNCHFLSRRTAVTACSISEVAAQAALLKAALQNDSYDFLISLTGHDYPLWSNSRIETFFEEHKGKILISAVSLATLGHAADAWRMFRPFQSKKGLFSHVSSLLSHTTAATGVQKTLQIHCADKTYDLYKGTPWWALSAGSARLVLREWEHNDHLRGYFKTSLSPADTFIPTVIFNSEYAGRGTLITSSSMPTDDDLSPLVTLTMATPLGEGSVNALLATEKMFCHGIESAFSGEKITSMIEKERK